MQINRYGRTAVAAYVGLLVGAVQAQQPSPPDDASDPAADPLNGEHSTQEEPRAGAAQDTDRDNSITADDPRVEPADRDVVGRGDEEIDATAARERRREIQMMAEQAIADLEGSGAADVDVEDAYGYAVFDTTKAGLIVTGAGGTGIAVDNATGEETYMHLGAGGIGLGAGLENYRLILVFEEQEAYDEFVAGQWDAGASAQAAAGEEGAAVEEQARENVEIYRISDEGLIAQADVTGIRFWRSERLNETG